MQCNTLPRESKSEVGRERDTGHVECLHAVCKSSNICEIIDKAEYWASLCKTCWNISGLKLHKKWWSLPQKYCARQSQDCVPEQKEEALAWMLIAALLIACVIQNEDGVMLRSNLTMPSTLEYASRRLHCV